MVRCFGLALICGSLGLTGCQFFNSTASTSASSPCAAARETQANAVELYMAFVERPLGDPFLNKNGPEPESCLWNCTDAHVVDFERQIQLEENGYRVGQIVGIVPSRLMTLLRSERACVNPRYRLVPCGEPTLLHLGPVLPRSSFQVKMGGQSEQVTLEQAQFALEIVAKLTNDGRTELKITPTAEHRRTAFAVEPSPDLVGYVPQTSRPQRRFSQLGWNVSLRPGETLVIGANLDKPGSLGQRSFTQEEGAEPVQRVLILRTSRPLEE